LAPVSKASPEHFLQFGARFEKLIGDSFHKCSFKHFHWNFLLEPATISLGSQPSAKIAWDGNLLWKSLNPKRTFWLAQKGQLLFLFVRLFGEVK
jgi:hypothetical protein